ncbi:MAG: tRNA lysidine(34) synthetase TilS [Lachnospiraceae bacterium]|nr:tRNA lysidine(34) synthetase TilS [Lachnospiraceae bacterium]
MIKEVKDYCVKNGLLAEGDRVLLGLSGGADSVCLLLVLLELAKEMNLSIFPVHIHHEIRGEEADRDLDFCRNLCAEHDLYLVEKHFDVKGIAQEKGMSLEEAGRMIRYQEFNRLARGLCCNRIAVAHHKNDQAETVLFHFFRGSKLKGLAGIEPRRGMIIRPLLCVSRKEIEEYLRESGQIYCTDSTNLEDDYTRNKIRLNILPEAEEICSGATDHIASAAAYLQKVESFLVKLTDKLSQEAVEIKPSGIHLKIHAIRKADTLIAERLIYKLICDAAGEKKDVTSLHVRQCMELCDKQTGKEINLINGAIVSKSYDYLVFKRAPKEEKTEALDRPTFSVFDNLKKKLDELNKSEEPVNDEPALKPFEMSVTSFPCRVMGIPGVGRMTFDLIEAVPNAASFIEANGGIPKSSYTKWFDYDKIQGTVLLRRGEKEDNLALYADGKGKKLFDVLADLKIPKEERETMTVLVCDHDVLWIPGMRGSEAYRISDRTKRILTVTMYGK